MTGRFHAVILSAIALMAPTMLRGQDIVVPAGTMLRCTISEPNLSSKTDAQGDPVLCDAAPLYVFGMPVLPRGAYLEGHFAYRNPGHFWGKGWMALNFDEILLPGAKIPLAVKVTSVPHLPVDAQGRIHGTGHAERDAIEWAIPPLWPVKIVTLPMRGPRPVLKGSETRVTLKLMQDLPIPVTAAVFPGEQLLKPGALQQDPDTPEPRLRDAMSNPQLDASFADQPPLASRQGTALVLRDGEGFLVRQYWFEDGQRIRYHAFDGTNGVLPIQALDLRKTTELNREHGVEFTVSNDDGEK